MLMWRPRPKCSSRKRTVRFYFDFYRAFDRSEGVSVNPNQIIILRTINLARKSSKNDSDGESARSQNSVTMIRTLDTQNIKFCILIGQNLSFFDTLTFFSSSKSSSSKWCREDREVLELMELSEDQNYVENVRNLLQNVNDAFPGNQNHLKSPKSNLK